MVLLMIPGLVIIMMLRGSNQAGAKQILGSLPIAIIMLLFIVASTWHMKIGMQVVIEDYVPQREAEARGDHAQQFLLDRGGARLDLRDSPTVIRSVSHGHRDEWQGQRRSRDQRQSLSD